MTDINGYDSEPHINPELLEVAGLEPEQQIRADALAAAAQLYTGAAGAARVAWVVGAADEFAAYIRTGQRP